MLVGAFGAAFQGRVSHESIAWRKLQFVSNKITGRRKDESEQAHITVRLEAK
jgi:hypothetical protein